MQSSIILDVRPSNMKRTSLLLLDSFLRLNVSSPGVVHRVTAILIIVMVLFFIELCFNIFALGQEQQQ